jgi:GT2 family glycosyltransferase
LPGYYLRLKKLSVILVSYNVSHFLEQALLSVRKALEQVAAEVFVVDNNSSDNTVAMVRQRFPEVKLLVNQENLGFSRANNQAIAQATGQYILLLNPDTVVAADTFTCCIKFMDDHPRAGGLGVQMLDGNGNYLPESMRGLPTPAVAFYKISGLTALFPRSKIFGRYYLGYLDRNQVQEVDVLAGAFMWLRGAALRQTGLLDESFFMYGEDIDLSFRLQKAGYRNYYLPYPRILHYKGESTRRGSLNYVYLFYRAMSVFVKKHFSGRQAFFFSGIMQLAIVSRALLSAGSRLARQLFSLLKPAGERFPRKKNWRIAVAGSAAAYHRAAALINAAQVPGHVVGFYSPHPADSRQASWLGSLSQLPEAGSQHHFHEIIFSSQDLAAGEIIAWMALLKNRGLHFKMLPEVGDYIIGSHSKTSRGQFYRQA